MKVIDLFEHQKISKDKIEKISEEKFNWDTFDEYLQKIWEDRKLYVSDDKIFSDDSKGYDREEESNKSTQQIFEILGKTIKPQNYVGFVQSQGIRFNIFPKIFNPDRVEDNNKINKEKINRNKIWKHLLFYLSKSKLFNCPFSDADVDSLDTDDLLEILIYLFANYTKNTVWEEPYSFYEEVTEETTFIKGRLDFPGYIRENLTKGRWQYFTCNHEPFQYDNLLNRIIKFTCRYLQSYCKESASSEILSSILFILDEVSDVKCTTRDCSKVKLNPLFENYKTILDMCKMFLENLSINNEDEENSNFSFLVPMEKIFEAFVFNSLNEICKEKEKIYYVESQSKKNFAIREDSKITAFEIRPDILLKKGKDVQAILDTKYKFRDFSKTEPERNKAGVSQSDIYQMVSYAVGIGCTSCYLIYPKRFNWISPNADDFVTFSIQSGLLNSLDIKITAVNIPVTSEEENYFKMKMEIEKGIKASFEKILSLKEVVLLE